MKGKLVVLVGPSGSGKSTFAQLYIEKHPSFSIFSSDKMRERMYGDESIQGDGAEVFRRLNEELEAALENGQDCILDAMNLHSRFRKELVNKFRPHASSIICWCMNVYKEFCLENQVKRSRRVPEEVILSQFKKFELPTFAEGWDEVHFYRPQVEKDKRKI